MNKLLILIGISLITLTACKEKDPYENLRKMAVQDYLDDKTKMREVLDKCANREIKDLDICETAKKAISKNFPDY